MNPRPRSPDSPFVGRWLRTASSPDLGYGFCTGTRGGKFVLSYVDIPEVAEHEVLVPRDEVLTRPIPTGTRVWVRGKPYGWHAGVISRAATGHRYHVSLVGHDHQLLLYQDQFVVRWARPLHDPAVAIAIGLSETPTYYEARSELLSELIRQRQVSRGLSAAISAPIHLFQHQLDTAARVLADPVMRYLLADEVGLGKTIEAGIVIRQLLLDDPRSKVLVLCPESLTGQWHSELQERLGLRDALQSPQLTVAPHSRVASFTAMWVGGLLHYDLIVIDEAHGLFEFVKEGSPIGEQLRQVDGLLALSATPMRGDEETFLRLLALVDPLAFGDASLESFRRRLDERDRSAGDVQVLATRRASVRQKSAVLDGVESDYSEDEVVRSLVAACRTSEDPRAECWTDLAEYVREIYRLSRRMIRHRRTSELTDEYAVAGRRPTFVEVRDPARPAIDDFLESYRMRLIGSGDALRYAKAVLHALAGPVALRGYLKRHAGEGERALFEMTIARLELAGLESRLRVVANVVRGRVDLGRRVVVVSSFPEVLERFDPILSECLDGTPVYRHYQSMTPDERDSSVVDFNYDYDGQVLLADTSMEEGRNLQLAHVLVNLDLPLDVNRLDQRIGRLDRYSERPEPAEVIVLTESASDWVSAHIALLSDGIGVFDVSVSTVQRLLGALLEGLVSNLLVKGVEALRLDGESLRSQLEGERDQVDLLEELESVEAASVFIADAFEELLAYEADPDRLRSAVHRLTTGTGSLALKPVESASGVVRFGGAQGIGVSHDEAESLDRLLQPKAFDRRAAVENPDVSPFRVGDPLVDWLEAYLHADERGRASAVVRPVPGIVSPTLWLHCEFWISFDAQQAAGYGVPIQRRLCRRAESYFQPMKLETWTDASGLAPDELIDEFLSPPFDPKRDEVLRGRTWQPVLEALPSWKRMCHDSAEAAWEAVRREKLLATAIADALEESERECNQRIAVLEARALRLRSARERQASAHELALELEAAQVLRMGIQAPAIRMVACGACVLWPEENF